MKKLSLVIMLVLAATLVTFSQTKKIAHRSHSGKNSLLKFDGADNFGVIYEPEKMKKREEERRKADSIAMKQKLFDLERRFKTDSLHKKVDTIQMKPIK